MKRYLLEWVIGEDYESQEFSEDFDSIQEVENKVNDLAQAPYLHHDSFRCLEVLREIKITPVEKVTKFKVGD